MSLTESRLSFPLTRGRFISVNRSDNIAAQIAADIRAVCEPLVGQRVTDALRLRARKSVEKVLRKYREAGVPVEDIRVLRDLSTGAIHVRVLQRMPSADENGVPIPREYCLAPCPVVSLDAFRRKKRPCKCCEGSGEILTGEFDWEGDLKPPEVCGRCSGSGTEPRFPGITKA